MPRQGSLGQLAILQGVNCIGPEVRRTAKSVSKQGLKLVHLVLVLLKECAC